jgi:heat shock protein HslJ
LTLWTESNQMLRFMATGKYGVQRTPWRLSQLVIEGDMAFLPLDGSSITLDFSDDDTAGGSSGCNSYGGSYALENDTLMFTNVEPGMEPGPQ